jgi:hypothetical protein
MAYTSQNFKTKKALKEAIAAGKKISVYQPGGIFPNPPYPGTTTVEGPAYPEPHRWYAAVTLDDQGYITKVK